jgi:prepilin-type N-terminal cleavage/methylation domain-containing protein
MKKEAVSRSSSKRRNIMAMEERNRKPKRKLGNVFYVGLLSFFGGISQDMFVPILPLYLTNVLGFSKEFIGLSEGILTAAASIFRLVAGWLSDKFKKQKPIIFVGYLLSMISRPLLAFTSAGAAIIGLRFTDGVGKGVKDAPKDVLIADSSNKEDRGRNFGIARALDTLGSVAGPILLSVLLYIFRNSLLKYHFILVFCGLPLIATLAILVFKVRETPAPKAQEKKEAAPAEPLPGFFYAFLAVIALFTLGNSSDAFLILRAQNVGVTLILIPLVYGLFNLVYASASVPLGSLSDKIGREKVILMGWCAYALTYIGFAFAKQAWQIWFIFAFYGLYYATTEGVAKAFVADMVGASRRGTAYGIYNTLVGILALPASVIAGFLWDKVSPAATFYFGAIMAAVSAIFLFALMRYRSRRATIKESNPPSQGFTLIELLIVIAIISVLMVVVLVTINPGELLKQSRDSNRLSDMATIQTAMNLFTLDQPNGALGTPSTTYVSLPDPVAPIGGNQCQSIGFPSSTYPYQCPASSTVRASNTTGWIPVNLNSISSGNPLSSLPIDPINQSSSGLFYTYQANGTQWEVTSIMESQKYRSTQTQSGMLPLYPGVIAKGSNLTLSGLYNPQGLVGYWPMDEGTGNTPGALAYDLSGNNNNGQWSGTPSGNNGTYYAQGKVGAYAGSFDGSTDWINAGTSPILNLTGSFTVSAWVNVPTTQSYVGIIGNSSGYLAGGFNFGLESGDIVIEINEVGGLDGRVVGGTVPLNQWNNVAFVLNGSTGTLYINGVVSGTGSVTAPASALTGFYIGKSPQGGWNPMKGLIDDARAYNRALSAAEIQAIYNAQK